MQAPLPKTLPIQFSFLSPSIVVDSLGWVDGVENEGREAANLDWGTFHSQITSSGEIEKFRFSILKESIVGAAENVRKLHFHSLTSIHNFLGDENR